MSHWPGEWLRFVSNEDGQDLVEYAFLTVFIALASAAVLVMLQETIAEVFGDSTGAVDSLWQPPEPV